MLSGDNGSVYATTDLIQRVVEPPFPMRINVTQGTGLNKEVNTELFWGMKTDIYEKPLDPSAPSAFDESMRSRVKHFPKHRKSVTPFAIGNNAGAADLVGGTVLDCDRFNNNRFSLEKIKIVTGSAADNNKSADVNKWDQAVYVRDGNIVEDHVPYTGRF